MGAIELLFVLQGLYYILTGLWPLVHIRSFLKVTGPKTDIWLVKTVGILITVIGSTLLGAGLSEYSAADIFVLAIGSQLALTTVDVFYVSNKTIAKIYLLDAVIELTFFAVWLTWFVVSLAD